MSTRRCAICGRSTLASAHVHAAPMPDELAELTAAEREARARSDGELVLLDGGARGFQRARLELPMQQAEGEEPLRFLVWVELTKGAWRSLRSVHEPGTSAEVAGLLATRIPGVSGSRGEHVRVRRRAEDALPVVVAGARGKLARLERPGALSETDRAAIARAMADELAPAVLEAFVAQRLGPIVGAWSDPSPPALRCVRVDAEGAVYATLGASALALEGPDGASRVELVLETRAPADERVPPLLLALARRAIATGAQLLPGMRLELAGLDVLGRGADRSFAWLAPALLGELQGGPLEAGPLHVHLLRVVPLHASEDALLAREGPAALARTLAASGLDPKDLDRPAATS